MDFSIHICEYNRSNADYDIIYRPEGSGDYLFLLFKTPMRVYVGKQFSITQENACIFYTPGHEQHYQAVQKFRNSYVHFWCNEDLGARYGIVPNMIFYPQNTEEIDEYIRCLQREYITKDPYAAEYEETLVRQMLITASRGMLLHRKAAAEPEGLYREFQELRLAMLSHYEKEWTMEKKTILSTLTETIIAGKTKDGKYTYFVYNMSEKNPDNIAIANQSIVLRIPITRITGDPLLEKAKAKARQ